MEPKSAVLPDRRIWLRVASPDWENPLIPGYARDRGGRWNLAGSYPVLYLNGDVATARMQIERLLRDTPVDIDDLDDGAFVLVAATLPKAQTCADAVTNEGLEALGLPATYPQDAKGRSVDATRCQRIGAEVRASELRGVWCRSACTSDGRGRELAWFPATSRSKARRVWQRARPFGVWRHASGWADLGLPSQREP